MSRKIVVMAATLAAFGHANAAVDVNVANEDALRSIRGIGPAKAQSILDERNAHGPFKDADDLARRVKGMGGHTFERLQAEGLAVGAAGAAGGVQTANAQGTARGTSGAASAQAAAAGQGHGGAVVVKQ